MNATTPPDHPPRSVTIERSGGIAGLKASVDLDLAALSVAQQSALRSVLRAADAHAGQHSTARGADRFSYRLRVVDADGRHRTVMVSEDELPDVLARLTRPALP
jgi:hypothetical protein